MARLDELVDNVNVFSLGRWDSNNAPSLRIDHVPNCFTIGVVAIEVKELGRIFGLSRQRFDLLTHKLKCIALQSTKKDISPGCWWAPGPSYRWAHDNSCQSWRRPLNGTWSDLQQQRPHPTFYASYTEWKIMFRESIKNETKPEKLTESMLWRQIMNKMSLCTILHITGEKRIFPTVQTFFLAEKPLSVGAHGTSWSVQFRKRTENLLVRCSPPWACNNTINHLTKFGYRFHWKVITPWQFKSERILLFISRSIFYGENTQSSRFGNCFTLFQMMNQRQQHRPLFSKSMQLWAFSAPLAVFSPFFPWPLSSSRPWTRWRTGRASHRGTWRSCNRSWARGPSVSWSASKGASTWGPHLWCRSGTWCPRTARLRWPCSGGRPRDNAWEQRFHKVRKGGSQILSRNTKLMKKSDGVSLQITNLEWESAVSFIDLLLP